MFQMYDVVKLKNDLPSGKLRAGTEGTILLVYSQPPKPPAYEVEFVDDEHRTLAVLTVLEDEIENA